MNKHFRAWVFLVSIIVAPLIIIATYTTSHRYVGFGVGGGVLVAGTAVAATGGSAEIRRREESSERRGGTSDGEPPNGP